MKIGILALQGSVKEHKIALQKCGVEPIEVRLPEDMDNTYGLIIPGGESTTIAKLIKNNGLEKEIRRNYELGMPIYGTCAGAILISKNIVGEKPIIGIMDITIKRNDYGRQINSFETELNIERLSSYQGKTNPEKKRGNELFDNFEKPFKGIFIRAPIIYSFHNGVKILSEFKNKPVMIQQDNLLVTTFHPELTDDIRIHKYFVDMIKNK